MRFTLLGLMAVVAAMVMGNDAQAFGRKGRGGCGQVQCGAQVAQPRPSCCMQSPVAQVGVCVAQTAQRSVCPLLPVFPVFPVFQPPVLPVFQNDGCKCNNGR